MRAIIEKIIDAGIHAPSGDNCQPWKFGLKNNSIYLFNIPQRDDSLYSHNQLASMLALGAVLENMLIAASHLGATANIKLFPEKENPNLVYILELENSKAQPQSLYPAIFLRATNRKFYKTSPLSDIENQTILDCSSVVKGAKIFLEKDEKKRKLLATCASSNEKLLFENRHLHSFFFQHINWNIREEMKKRIGFYIKTLELPLPVRLGFHLFRHWGFVKIFNKIGFSSMVAKTNAGIYSSSAALGLVTMPTNSKKAYLLAGRVVERIWLTATQNNLAFQPLTGIFFLHQKILNNNLQNINKEQSELVEKKVQEVKNNFFLSNETPIIMFRIGQAEPPSARTSRLAPIIIELK
jgi:hypothetical protein